jgi:hypothetical protein
MSDSGGVLLPKTPKRSSRGHQTFCREDGREELITRVHEKTIPSAAKIMSARSWLS